MTRPRRRARRPIRARGSRWIGPGVEPAESEELVSLAGGQLCLCPCVGELVQGDQSGGTGTRRGAASRGALRRDRVAGRARRCRGTAPCQSWMLIVIGGNVSPAARKRPSPHSTRRVHSGEADSIEIWAGAGSPPASADQSRASRRCQRQAAEAGDHQTEPHGCTVGSATSRRPRGACPRLLQPAGRNGTVGADQVWLRLSET